MAAAKAFERYFYDFSLHELWAKQYVKSKGQYIALRHVAFCTVGLVGLIDTFFPFNPPFPTIGMCPNGWKGTWVCEADKHKAMEMYTEWKSGKKAAHH
ncbi:mitochondrial F1F0 ATP synthase associated protein [Haematococcus lacustris]